ncbi:phenylacetate--CoA ligase family protein [Saccharopolyspora phatthalungensis]|uniref:Phenylacetate-coenzyme A ligase PaaK-like adenylate-forming protein n=1 Tax=Saccharopolyspora phatthalungensis TaxID=664693 RepID=A0A840QA48_9PSEU|nr:phenylacetate--CoA ligase family protein [Saccharopolyspora phatthalungensis]MBB5159412.1 phenylacetate-coenzyme A ligase PaaK-like adenylate-forming protein [Saccharopolyspora phatthalungensis]
MSESVGGTDRVSVAKAEYGRLRAGHLSAVSAALEDHVARLDWPRERIERYRDQRLRALLAYARERSPFHAARTRGLDPSSATVADLVRLPVMTKQEAQEEWDAIVTVPGLDREKAEHTLAGQAWFSYTPEGQQIFSSGGSTGVRGVYAWDWELFVTLACLAWRMQAREERRGPPLRHPARLAVLEAGVPPHASTPLFDVPSAAGMETVVIPASAPFDEVLAAVAAARPTHLVGYATVIGRLARAALAGMLEIHPVRVSTNSEPLFEEDQRAIREAWHVPVHNLWGSTEIGVQAVGCGRGVGLHVCEDEVVLERVDEAGTSVAPDEPAARTLATGLANRTFPFIRYDLGDEITPLPGRCECGSSFARLADIAGRRDDDFRYPACTIPASVFRHVLGTDPRVSEYQVRQTRAGAEILVVGAPDAAALTSSVTAELRRHGLPEPEVRIRPVDRLPRHEATGKLRRFIALR